MARGLHQRGNILYIIFSQSRSVFHQHLSIYLPHFSPLNFLHFVFQGLDPDTQREEKKKSKVLTTFSSLFCYSVVLFSSFSANFIIKFIKSHFQDGCFHLMVFLMLTIENTLPWSARLTSMLQSGHISLLFDLPDQSPTIPSIEMFISRKVFSGQLMILLNTVLH